MFISQMWLLFQQVFICLYCCIRQLRDPQQRDMCRYVPMALFCSLNQSHFCADFFFLIAWLTFYRLFYWGAGGSFKSRTGFYSLCKHTFHQSVILRSSEIMSLSSENVVADLPIHAVLLMPFPNTRGSFQLDDMLELRYNRYEK